MIANPHRIHRIIDRLHDMLNYPMKDHQVQAELQIIAGELNGIAMTLNNEYEDNP
jgi:hypothetical protein